jgi:hypothetical protein
MALSINLTLDTVAQAEAVQAALELYVDMETDRGRDESRGGGDPSFTDKDRVRLAAAKRALEMLTGPHPAARRSRP